MSDSSKGKRVEIYTTVYCPYCRAAKELLNSKGVAFEEIDVTDSAEQRQRLSEMCGGRETVPVIVVGGECLGGYRELVEFYRSGKSL